MATEKIISSNSEKTKSRILLACEIPLSQIYGTGQVAVSLGKALSEREHEVTLWFPESSLENRKWWVRLFYKRKELNNYLKGKTFDIIDCRPTMISAAVKRSASVVVSRSNQPELYYQISTLTQGRLTLLQKAIRIPHRLIYTFVFFLFVFNGWKKADLILSLGSLEFQWMNKWFPFWRHKMHFYLHAIPVDERRGFEEIREQRRIASAEKKGNRYLWIGRWVNHKGIHKLTWFIRQRSKKCPNDTFTIAGCGNDAEKDLPKDLIEAGRVKIIPSFSREELFYMLSDHDVGLFTSTVEGWGLVLNEMLEAGLPVFATSVGAVEELKPFFPKMLHPFPPPLDIKLNQQQVPYDFSNYYNAFCWSQIAKDYELTIDAVQGVG